ncbi:MAG TPA: membrane protein insertion efficiency factor YidD [Actinomycetota bacterium]|nr:membrane protein insertion efficiency factor YidD [Actinomycetota bacterium]
MTPAARLILRLIRLYQDGVSARRAPACRWQPSCSRYAAEAVQRHGALRGTYLATRRLLRCHPLRPGGVDLVPERFTLQAPISQTKAAR